VAKRKIDGTIIEYQQLLAAPKKRRNTETKTKKKLKA
jgi:hypothetical protein